jgi:acyl-[acyl-carrier-protein] desaturase
MTSQGRILKNVRLEVMMTLESSISQFVDKFLTPVERIWQPTDFLPNPQSETFMDEVKEIRELSKDMDDDFWAVSVGDMITEEALPTYEAWLMNIEGVRQIDDEQDDNGWAKWVRAWSAEENRHGDVMNKYLYLSGRVNMREVEITTHHLIADGFDMGTSCDPYRNFVYTSFQELATYYSHNNVAKIAKKNGHDLLARMCKMIAGDEMRHHLAYSEFVNRIFEYDPNQMMMAFHAMMKKKIVMPAMFMREKDGAKGDVFDQFSIAAQRLGIYTGFDYVEILEKLNAKWNIENIRGLNSEAERAREYLVKLPERMKRITERMVIPKDKYQFSWLNPAI